jgi:hypothetical protein
LYETQFFAFGDRAAIMGAKKTNRLSHPEIKLRRSNIRYHSISFFGLLTKLDVDGVDALYGEGISLRLALCLTMRTEE